MPDKECKHLASCRAHISLLSAVILRLESVVHRTGSQLYQKLTPQLASMALSLPDSSLNKLATAAVQAYQRIQPYVLRTNLMHSTWLSSVGQCSAYLKLESEQHTNSFKVRGALNKVL